MKLARDLLLHPVRLRIVQALAGQPMKPRQLNEQLPDVPQASLYRHISQLQSGGLIQVVDERPVRGTVERTFGLVKEAVSMGEDDLVGAGAADHLRFFSTFVGTLVADYAAYVESSELELNADRVGYRQVPLWLSDEEFDGMTAEITAAIGARLGNERGSGRRRRLLTTIVMPDNRAPVDPRSASSR